MLCNKCNAEIPDNSLYCPHCGAYTTEQTFRQNTTFDASANTQYTNMYQVKSQENEPVSVGMWLGIFLINLIPCVGCLVYMILMFVWAFGNNTKKSLKNFARAQLIILLIAACILVLVLIFVSLTNWDVFMRRPDVFDGYRYYYFN